MKWIGAHIFDYISRFRNDMHVDAKVVDSTGSAGSSGDILITTGTTVEWATPSLITSSTYTHKQSVSSTEWRITHNLNKFPSVTVVDSAGTTVVGHIKYETKDLLIVTFLASFGGKAYLN
jgi:hypothetical protein